MDVYSTEEEQVEAIRKWWRDNGKSVIFGVVLGLAAVFGWRGWQEHRAAQAMASSELFQDVLTSLRSDTPDKARAPAEEIVKNYSGTGYGLLARLVLAKLDVDSQHLDQAAGQLKQALAATSQTSLELEIRLRLARVQTAAGNLDTALATLDVKDPGSYAPDYAELRGDILARQGKAKQAYTAYEEAKQGYTKNGLDTSMLEMKMADLGVANQG